MDFAFFVLLVLLLFNPRHFDFWVHVSRHRIYLQRNSRRAKLDGSRDAFGDDSGDDMVADSSIADGELRSLDVSLPSGYANVDDASNGDTAGPALVGNSTRSRRSDGLYAFDGGKRRQNLPHRRPFARANALLWPNAPMAAIQIIQTLSQRYGLLFRNIAPAIRFSLRRRSATSRTRRRFEDGKNKAENSIDARLDLSAFGGVDARIAGFISTTCSYVWRP